MMPQEEISLFLTEERARERALLSIRAQAQGAYRIIAGTLKCADRSVEKGFKVQILQADMTHAFWL